MPYNMARDILIYGTIHEYNVLYFFDQLMQAELEDPDGERKLRINCDGGNPQYGMGYISKIQELQNVDAIVEGGAHSMGLFMLCYINKVSAIETSQGVLHRAAYSSWLEQRDGFEDSVYYDILTKTNKNLEKAFRARVDVDALEALPQMKDKGWTLKDIFSLESRNEVLLTASDMKKIGLINNVIKITPQRSAQIQSLAAAFDKCGSLNEYRLAAQAVAEPKPEPKKTQTMTLDELKAQHPALYNEAFTAGITKERDRVEAWMAFVDIDQAAVAKGIEEGKDLSAKSMAEFTRKGMSVEALKKIEEENAPGVTTEPDKTVPKTEKQKELEAFEAKIQAELKRQKIIA